MMKHLFSLLMAFLLAATAPLAAQESQASTQGLIDSLEKSFRWQTGSITLGDNLATMAVPAGWRYLNPEQSAFVLSTIWGNPPSTTLGMLFPSMVSPLDTSPWAFDINYEDIGFVKDDDADDFKYDEILTDLQKGAEEANDARVKEGYDAVKILGWASTPYYDKEKKVLHWAKDIQFGESQRILNYDVRLLGRKGVLSMNAIANIDRVEEVKGQVPAILGSVAFTDGNRYADFDSKIDNVAAWTIGGLVAGKVLAKAGFFAIILKFIKPILLLLFGGGATIWRWVTGRKKEEVNEPVAAETPPSTPENNGPNS